MHTASRVHGSHIHNYRLFLSQSLTLTLILNLQSITDSRVHGYWVTVIIIFLILAVNGATLEDQQIIVSLILIMAIIHIYLVL